VVRGANIFKSGVRNHWIEVAAAFVLFSLTFAWFGRAWLHRISDSVAVDGPLGAKAADAQLIIWILTWVSRRLRSDFGRILDAPINYPSSQQLTGSEHLATSQLLFFPINAVIDNPLIAANLTAMLLYPLTASSMFAFMRMIGVRPPAAIFAGFGLALGPLQVPGNIQILQILMIFFPLTAIAIRRLRESPDLVRTLTCAACYLAALLSSFYLAMLNTIFFFVWSVVEGIRSGPRRIRFAISATASLSAAGTAFLAISWPYLHRQEIQDGAAGGGLTIWTPEMISLARETMLSVAFTEHAFGIGAVLSIVALLGLVSLSQDDLRAYALAGIVLAGIGMFIALNGLQQLANADLPRPLDELLTFCGRFFRMTPRGLLLTGFSFAILGGLGLETLRRWSPRVAAGAVAMSVTLLLVTRGLALGGSELVQVRAFGEYSSVYHTVREITAASDRSALLELPRHQGVSRADAEAMMGQLLHRLPLVTGYTGYQPPYRWKVDQFTRPPIRHEDLQNLVEMTNVRWILLRPPDDWPVHRRQGRTAEEIRSFHGFAREYEIDEFILFELTDVGEEPSDDAISSRRKATGKEPVRRRDIPAVVASQQLPPVGRRAQRFVPATSAA
jgi:hypothetical protein